MKNITIGKSTLKGSRLAYGCWRVAGSWNPAEVTPASEAAGRAAIRAAYDAGYTVFDNADIYCGGRAEEIFGQALREIPGMRERIIVVTKAGIRTDSEPKRWDFSGEYLVTACEASLRRMKIETIDLFLLHRPDWLADPNEIAGAFAQLRDAGKVRFFGVSNFRPSLVNALQAACPFPLVTNQVEISLMHREPLEDGTLDQCLEKEITPMAWSPLAAGVLADGAARLLPSQQTYKAEFVVKTLDEIAAARGVTRSAIALAWLLKHPSRIMPIVGSTDPKRIRDAAKADEFEMSREEWYQLFLAARGEPLP